VGGRGSGRGEGEKGEMEKGKGRETLGIASKGYLGRGSGKRWIFEGRRSFGFSDSKAKKSWKHRIRGWKTHLEKIK
jgi:hypothetical protein